MWWEENIQNREKREKKLSSALSGKIIWIKKIEIENFLEKKKTYFLSYPTFYHYLANSEIFRKSWDRDIDEIVWRFHFFLNFFFFPCNSTINFPFFIFKFDSFQLIGRIVFISVDFIVINTIIIFHLSLPFVFSSTFSSVVFFFQFFLVTGFRENAETFWKQCNRDYDNHFATKIFFFWLIAERGRVLDLEPFSSNSEHKKSKKKIEKNGNFPNSELQNLFLKISVKRLKTFKKIQIEPVADKIAFRMLKWNSISALKSEKHSMSIRSNFFFIITFLRINVQYLRH